MHLTKIVPSLLLLLGLLGNWRLADAAQPTSNIQAPIHIQAHRGAGMKLPENTLESFSTCWQVRVTPEADLQTTKDGIIVCFHDSNLRRVVSNLNGIDKNSSIAALPLAKVKTLEVGSFRGEEYRGQRVPTLAEVFSAMRGRSERMIYLDIKKVDLDDLVALIRKFDVESQVIFATSQHNLILDWRKRLPDSKTLLWNGGTQGAITKKLNAARTRDFEGITHLQVHVRPGNLDGDRPFAPSQEFLEATRDELKERGIVFQVYAVNCADHRAYDKLLELGIESIATDYPQVTLVAAREFQRRSAQVATTNTARTQTGFERLFREIDQAREFGKLVKSRMAGGKGGGSFESTPGEPTLLVGFDYTVSTLYGGHLTFKSIRPIYATRRGDQHGAWHGRPHGKIHRVLAKKGYVVTAVVAKHGHRIDGMRLLYMRVRGGGLNPADTYRSDWLGGRGGGGETLYATYGDPIVSIFGRQGNDLDAIGFLQLDTKK